MSCPNCGEHEFERNGEYLWVCTGCGCAKEIYQDKGIIKGGKAVEIRIVENIGGG